MGAPPVTPANPRMIHLALMAGVALVVVVLTFLRTSGLGVALEGSAAQLLRYVGLAILLANALLAQVMRRNIPPLPMGADDGQWWREHLGRAIVVWALLEGAALVQAVFYYLTGDLVLLGLAVIGLFLLWMARPSRLLE